MRLDHLLSTENLIVCLAWFPGFSPWGVGRAGVEGLLRLLEVAGMGMLLGSLAATALLVWGLAFGCPPWVPVRLSPGGGVWCGVVV